MKKRRKKERRRNHRAKYKAAIKRELSSYKDNGCSMLILILSMFSLLLW